MAIPRLKIDISDLLNGVDRVSNSIIDCIDLAESSLCNKKIGTEPKKPSPRLDHSGNIFSGLDRIDQKIAGCIKLAEDTFRAGSFNMQRGVKLEPHQPSPRSDHSGKPSKIMWDSLSDSNYEETIPQLLDP